LQFSTDPGILKYQLNDDLKEIPMEAAAAIVNSVCWGAVCAGLSIALIYRLLKVFVFSV
jgi:hypothetical protein